MCFYIHVTRANLKRTIQMIESSYLLVFATTCICWKGQRIQDDAPTPYTLEFIVNLYHRRSSLRTIFIQAFWSLYIIFGSKKYPIFLLN